MSPHKDGPTSRVFWRHYNDHDSIHVDFVKKKKRLKATMYDDTNVIGLYARNERNSLFPITGRNIYN